MTKAIWTHGGLLGGRFGIEIGRVEVLKYQRPLVVARIGRVWAPEYNVRANGLRGGGK